MPGGLHTQRDPGAGGRPAQAGGAEVGSLGWGGPGGERAGKAVRDVRCQRKDKGDLGLPFPQGRVSTTVLQPWRAGRVTGPHFTDEDTEAREVKG